MLENIKIKNFRGIKELEINNLKRINLFVGDNGCGKTTILNYIGKHLEPDDLLFRTILLDEFCNNVHYSRHEEEWHRFFEVVRDNLDFQVFATTHSIDCIKAFHKVAMDYWNEDEKNKDIISFYTVKNNKRTRKMEIINLDIEYLGNALENIEVR